MPKYTDEQIKQALESEIRRAEYTDTDYLDCVEVKDFKLALDLINRQEADYKHLCELYNERVRIVEEQDRKIVELEAEIERLQKENNRFADIGKMYSEIKSEAIKEFAEKLKAKIHDSVYQYWNFGEGGYYLAEDVDDDIDNLAKEMVGEK